MTKNETPRVVVTEPDVAAANAYWPVSNEEPLAEHFARHRTAAEAASRAREDALREIANEAAFLLDRLRDLDWSQGFEGLARDYNGHVDPSESRLRGLIADYRAALTPATGEEDAESEKAADGERAEWELRTGFTEDDFA